MKIINTLLISLGICASVAYAQDNDTMLFSALNQRIVRIQSFDDADTAEFAILKSEFAGSKVVGLGEATHGTKEFYQYKAKLIKYLVEHHNLRVLVFESDMVGMESINDYVQSKGGLTLEQAMNNYGLFDIYRTQEVVDLIEWIRAFNSTRAPGQKVMIAGIDANLPYSIASRLLQSTALAPYLDGQLKKDLADIRSIPEIRNFGQARKKYLFSVAHKLGAIVQDKVNPDSLMIYSHYIRLLTQSLRMINLGDIASNKARDAHMAENVMWLLEKTAGEGTLAIWGHNGHICADKWRGYRSTGAHLRSKLKDRYYALGLEVGEGYARLWDSVNRLPYHNAQLPAIQNTNQLEFVLKQLKYPNFFLSLQGVRKNKLLADYFSKPLLTRVLGAQVARSEKDILLPLNVAKSYNGIVFFRETTAAAEIKF